MPSWKEGDRVRVVERDVLAEDRRTFRYFEHMAGVVGTVQNVYGPEDVAIKVDSDALSKVAADVQKEAVRRLREKFLANVSEEAKGKLTADELNFSAHYMILVRAEDLERAS